MNSKGEIIAVVGAPSIGKSTFVRYLGDNYQVKTFFEGEASTLPYYIKENIAQNKNRLQTSLYFHNRNISQYIEALELKKKAYQIILDTFWLTNLFFLDDKMYENPAEQDLVRDLIKWTNRSLVLPDKVIVLEADNDLIRDRCLSRGRKFEEKVIENFYRANDLHKEFFEKQADNELPGSKIIKIKAADIDYDQIAKKLKLIKN